ncbi:MAG TPA: DUF488 family protein [Clostridia bacterium]|nr:DUF488 family protein [Clostridia bacterium]
MIFVKRVYDPVETSDGLRFLVDGLWPRGVKKESAHLNAWLKGVSPSHELRTWFAHDPEKWEEFQTRYFAELDEKPKAWGTLLESARSGDLTLVFSAQDAQYNNAVALRLYLIKHLKNRKRTQRHSVAAHN